MSFILNETARSIFRILREIQEKYLSLEHYTTFDMNGRTYWIFVIGIAN